MISFFKILAYKAQTATMYCDTYLKAVQFIFLKDISPFEILKKKVVYHKRISSLRPNVKRALNLSFCAEKYWDEKIRNLKVQVIV